MHDKESISVSISHRVNLGNYESADAYISLCGLTVDTTEEEMNALLDQGKIAYRLMGERLKAQLSKLKTDLKT